MGKSKDKKRAEKKGGKKAKSAKNGMNIVEATRSYEDWLRACTSVVNADLVYKHAQMRSDPFLFFRATFYRWSQLWPRHCPKLAKAPEVVSVGDLHMENFGTWRDTEGRLIWGVNDFDEALPMAFPHDLVRLTVSAFLANSASSIFDLSREKICEQLLIGYEKAINDGGEPLVLAERHPSLRAMAIQQLRQPAEFWKRLDEKTAALPEKPNESVLKAIQKILPDGAEPEYRIVKIPKGLGSLGRIRYIALVQWNGALIAREAKAVVPSAVRWARGQKPGQGNPWLQKTADSAVRCADPFYQVHGDWLVRRLGPDCSRIDVEELDQDKNVFSLLRNMGYETANIHLATPKAKKIITHFLDKLSKDWLFEAATKMHDVCLRDWKDFGREFRGD